MKLFTPAPLNGFILLRQKIYCTCIFTTHFIPRQKDVNQWKGSRTCRYYILDTVNDFSTSITHILWLLLFSTTSPHRRYAILIFRINALNYLCLTTIPASLNNTSEIDHATPWFNWSQVYLVWIIFDLISNNNINLGKIG